MKLVVDTNILVLFFRQTPIYYIVSKASSHNLQLFIPELAIEELENNKDSIIKYSNKSQFEFDKSIEKLKSNLIIVDKKDFEQYENEAKFLAPHEKDIPFFALALHLKAPIWSNELAFQSQSKIKIFRTKDLIEII